MLDTPSMRQRIAIVDPAPRSREHARRAVRGLGHAPMVFASVEELLAIGRSVHRYALMCFGVSADTQDVRQVIDKSREVVGRDVPIMFFAPSNNSKALRDLGRIRQDEHLITPSSFAEIYNALEGFMTRHNLPLAEDGLAWGHYRFYPACALAKVQDTEVWLDSLEFELALEFFHNVDRPLTSEWLKVMVPRPPVRSWPRWLDSRVNHLRSQLDLGSARDWPTVDKHCRGYLLHSVAKQTRLPAEFAIERFVQS